MAGIFISYRREDAAGHAGRLFDRLAQHFGRDKVFMDVAGIEPGVDFVEAIDQAVGSCDVLIVVIGKEWARAADAAGKRRLDDPNDFVRLEATTALRRNVRVIPLLVDGAPLPPTGSLPEDLQKLTRRNAFELRDGRWESDIGLLVEALEKALGHPAKPDRPAARVEEAADRRRVRFVPMAIGAAVIGAFAIAGWVEWKDDTIDPTPTPVGATPTPAGATPAPVNTPSTDLQAKVPSLIGLRREAVAQSLDEAGLELGTVTTRQSAGRDPGTVIDQDSDAGSRVLPGTRVNIVLAQAPAEPEPPPPDRPAPVATLEMPNLVGLPPREAVDRLVKAGLRLGRSERRRVSDAAQSATVIEQSVSAGATIEKGATIDLVVGSRAARARQRGTWR
jgi:hypothetical protein